MVISYITLLPIGNLLVVAVDVGIATNPIPVRLEVIKVDVMAIKTNVSNESIIVVNVLHFIFFFQDLLFLSLK